MASLAAIVGFWQSLENADKAATLFINSLNSPISDSIWAVLSMNAIWYPFYLLIAIFLYLRLNWKKATIVLISCILTIVACDQFANFTKDFFQRLRPCWDIEMLRNGLVFLEGRGSHFGFYSAHAANAMGFAMASYLGFRHDKSRKYNIYSIAVFIWAILVGFSRIFVGKHFLGDVLTGMAIGLIFAWIFSKIASRLIASLSRH